LYFSWRRLLPVLLPSWTAGLGFSRIEAGFGLIWPNFLFFLTATLFGPASMPLFARLIFPPDPADFWADFFKIFFPPTRPRLGGDPPVCHGQDKAQPRRTEAIFARPSGGAFAGWTRDRES
jgi:hypothetical protein